MPDCAARLSIALVGDLVTALGHSQDKTI